MFTLSKVIDGLNNNRGAEKVLSIRTDAIAVVQTVIASKSGPEALEFAVAETGDKLTDNMKRHKSQYVAQLRRKLRNSDEKLIAEVEKYLAELNEQEEKTA